MVDLKSYISELKIKNDQGINHVWDPVRQKWIQLTHEEMVRQCILLHLSQTLGYPTGLMSVERAIQYYQRRKRYDIVVYDRSASPLLLVECKAPDVALSLNSIEQITIYDEILNGQILWLTNGHQHILRHKINDRLEPLIEIPSYIARP